MSNEPEQGWKDHIMAIAYNEDSHLDKVMEYVTELEARFDGLLRDSAAIVDHIGCAGCMNSIHAQEGGQCYTQLRRFEDTVRRLYREGYGESTTEM